MAYSAGKGWNLDHSTPTTWAATDSPTSNLTAADSFETPTAESIQCQNAGTNRVVLDGTSTLLLNSETAEKWRSAKTQHIVLHVGPHKTGSSSMQRFLQEDANTLRSDGFQQPSFLDLPPGRFKRSAKPANSSNQASLSAGDHRKRTANLAFFLQENDAGAIQSTDDQPSAVNGGKRPSKVQMWLRFKRWASRMKATNSSIVLSSEEFDKKSVAIDLLATVLETERTTIVVGYRPFHDFMLSIYRQVSSKSLRGVGTLPVWLQPKVIQQYASLFTDAVVERYAAHGFADIALAQLGSNMTAEFACSVLQANNTCAIARNKAAPIVNVRKKQAHVCGVNEQQQCVDEGIRAMLINETVRTNRAITCLLRAGTLNTPNVFRPEVNFDLGPTELCTCVAR